MFSIFREIVGQARSSLKPSLNYQEIKQALEARVKGRTEFEEDLPWMDVEDFLKRYRNVRFSAIVAGVLGGVSLVTVAFSDSIQGFLLSLLSFLILELFYIKLNFLLWASRETVFVEGSRIVRITDYLVAISKDPQQLLPLTIAHGIRKTQ